MKFFMWYQSFAIYGAREQLILLQANPTNSSVSLFSRFSFHFDLDDCIQVNLFSYHWPIDASTMDECLQEWNIKVKDRIISVRFITFCFSGEMLQRHCSRSSSTEQYSNECLCNLRSSTDDSFIWFSIDVIWSWRSTHSWFSSTDRFRTFLCDVKFQSKCDHCRLSRRLYSNDTRNTRQNITLRSKTKSVKNKNEHRIILIKPMKFIDIDAYFIGGFPYDGKAVFALVEPSDRFETVSDANRKSIYLSSSIIFVDD